MQIGNNQTKRKREIMPPSAMQMIIDSLKQLNDKVDSMMIHGCAKAETHHIIQEQQGDIFKRLNLVEIKQAEGRGKLIAIVFIAGAALTAASEVMFRWISSKINL